MVGSQKSENSHKNFQIWRKGNLVGFIIKFLFCLRNSGKGMKGKMGETAIPCPREHLSVKGIESSIAGVNSCTGYGTNPRKNAGPLVL